MEGIVACSSDFSGKQGKAVKGTLDGNNHPVFPPALSPRDHEMLSKVNKFSFKGNGWVKWFLKSLSNMIWYSNPYLGYTKWLPPSY